MSPTDLRLLAVHAHADDETITMGATLAQCAARGIRTAVLCCTDGQLATIYAPDMPEEETRPRLGEIRREELRAAGAILGVSEVHFLGYHDSGMAGADSNNDPVAFWRAPLDEAIGKVVARIRAFRPHVVVTYDANGGYGHPDHIMVHRVTLLAVEAAYLGSMYHDAGEPWRVSKLYYTAFPERAARRAVDLAAQFGAPSPFGDTAPEDLEFVTRDELVTTTVSAPEQMSQKLAALRAHHSQITEDFPYLAVPEQLAREHFSDEYFQLVMSHVPVQTPETDLFAGLGD
ncbi:MAG TPA: N-acetyl-1-D-myo-inositol-2-amino-2-deoxy-alpha-D-glucopyranoside deacetylase [Candidatus Angelobacter sp.]|jgi:N-acetyl-1-D-myo-inositol-2-amino-2-deoxy-alpha-D-glucopyranoside deacetylase|nr:N-acetyl-1-D-myo-inositol-2-amino-2-deoxy-alpha-D-glucopyranoside deacetylase [Candidatus Angelobacter sp.]